MGWMPRAEEAMTDQQPVEPDAILDRDGAAVLYRRARAGLELKESTVAYHYNSTASSPPAPEDVPNCN
jgi:hypothetical protein